MKCPECQSRDVLIADLEATVNDKDTQLEQLAEECSGWIASHQALEAIVAKLPKDAEGVPCVPGDRRWAWTHPGGGEAAVLRGEVCGSPGAGLRWCIGFVTAAHPTAVDKGYSTKEAAEAAREVK